MRKVAGKGGFFFAVDFLTYRPVILERALPPDDPRTTVVELDKKR